MHPKKRRIKSAKISFISLVPRGSNGVASIIKGASALSQSFVTLAKIGVEGLLYTIVYAPNVADDQGDFADPATVRQMAHDFLLNKEQGGVDVLHSCEPLEPSKARLCETFIIQKGDPRFEGIKTDTGEPFDPTGAWGAVIKVEDPALLAKYTSGEWVGVSMYGTGFFEPVTKESNPQTEVHQVDETKLAAALDAVMAKREAALVQALVKAFTPAAPDKDKAAPAVDVPFEGDPNSIEDMEKQAEKVLFVSLDMSKPADIAKWQAHLVAKAAKAKTPPATGTPDAATLAKITALEGEIAKLRGAASPTGDPGTGGGLKKTSSELLLAAKARATELRKQGVIR